MSCIENNNFVLKQDCINDYNNNKSLDLYIQPAVTFCKTGENINNGFCKGLYDNSTSRIDNYNQQKFNLFLSSDYSVWNKYWKDKGCFSDLPINIYNNLINLTNDNDKKTLLNQYASSLNLSDRNLCYTGETIENGKSLNVNNCIYSQNKKFKLCQLSNGDLVLYNIDKNTNKIINSAKKSSIPSNILPYLLVQSDGNVVNYNKNNQSFWNANTQILPNAKNKKVFIVLRNDGKVILYNQDGVAVKEINNIAENFENEPVNCCNPKELVNNPSCNNDYINSYKVYLTDMNKYCKINNNIIDKDLCDELFNNPYNLNEYDNLVTKKKDVCLNSKNHLNQKCINFNNKYTDQLNKQIDFCKNNPTNPDCRKLYTEYNKINPNNEFIKSTNNILWIILLIFIALFSGVLGFVYYKNNNKNRNNNKNNNNNRNSLKYNNF